MAALSFDRLNSVQFEEFVFDLLVDLGFKNVDWRKGTGLSSSPSDQGRDIECAKLVKDEIDGEITLEKWFVDAKHQKKGVPPNEVDGALAWASAERPSCLLLVASGYFSNPCKEFIDVYIRKNRPPFRIKIWELKDLEKITFSRSMLLKKYGIGDDLGFISIMNPIHLKYAATIHYNSLNYFFQLIDGMDPKKRDEILEHAYFEVIDPEIRSPVTGKERLGELYSRRIDYESFRKRCYELEFSEPKRQLVDYIVGITLGYLFNLGDSTKIDTRVDQVESQIGDLENMQKNADKMTDLQVRLHLDEDALKKRMEHTISILQKHSDEIPSQTRYYYRLYLEFCQEIVLRLMDEELMEKESTRRT